MTLWSWRIAKYLAFAVLAAGLFEAVQAPAAQDRQRAVTRRVIPGFVGVCMAGYGLMKAMHYELSEAWIFQGFVASAAAVTGAIVSAEGERLRRLGAAAALGGLAAAIAVMVTRSPDGSLLVLLALLSGGLMGAWLAPPRSDAPSADHALRFFRTVARLEGLSLILLVCIAMPLRKLTGIELDGGQGWIGWTHGILVVLYLPALWSAWWSAPLSLVHVAAGFFASLLPGGTFAFERWALPRD